MLKNLAFLGNSQDNLLIDTADKFAPPGNTFSLSEISRIFYCSACQVHSD